MDVGVQMVFASYGWSNMSDEEVWDEELERRQHYPPLRRRAPRPGVSSP